MKLLTPAFANTKTAKNDSTKYLSFILHLAPSNLSGYNTCPRASKGCRLACLNTAGRGQFNSVQQARIRKTRLYFEDRQAFLTLLRKDLNAVLRKAARNQVIPVVRLNGTSDLDWTDIIAEFPSIQFYDYTKVISRLERPLPSNYHLTFSRSECNDKDCLKALSLGFNVAVVFKDVPYNYFAVPVIDGDSHDLRFLDPGKGAIVALRAKGKAKKDVTRFVV